MEFEIPLSDHKILHELVNNIVLQIFSALGKMKSHISFVRLWLLYSRHLCYLKVLGNEIFR